jgi:hypothetical protein
MNTVSIIVSILIPLIVISYIIVDLFSKRTAKVSKASYDSEIDEKIHATGENNGDRLSQDEILDNTSYLVDNLC